MVQVVGMKSKGKAYRTYAEAKEVDQLWRGIVKAARAQMTGGGRR